MVPFREAVELFVRKEVVLEETGGECRVWEPIRHGDQRHQRRPQVLDAVQILLGSLLGCGRGRARDSDVIFWRWAQHPTTQVSAAEVFAYWRAST
jgi:hypothetical protein